MNQSHFKSNHIVTLNGIEPNTPSIKLTADIVSTSIIESRRKSKFTR